MAKCKYCRHDYTVPSWYARSQNARSICPDCADKLSAVKGYWETAKDYINQIRHGAVDDGGVETGLSSGECDDPSKYRVQKGLKKVDDGEFTVYGRWVLSGSDEYDEDGEEFDYGCTLTFKTKGVMEVHGNLTLRNMTIEVYGGRKDCEIRPAIIVDGTASFRNCHFIGHGARQAVVCKSTLLLEDCRVSKMECRSQKASVFEVIEDSDYWTTEIMCGSSFDECRSECSFIRTGDVNFRDHEKLIFSNCTCKGPFIKSKDVYDKDKICSIRSSEMTDVGDFTVSGFRKLTARLIGEKGLSANFSRVLFDGLKSNLKDNDYWGTLDAEEIWVDLYKEYKRLPTRISNDIDRSNIYSVMWQLVCLYAIKGDSKVKHLALLKKMFSALPRYNNKNEFWELEIEKCMCDVLDVDSLSYWEDMPSVIKDAITGD